MELHLLQVKGMITKTLSYDLHRLFGKHFSQKNIGVN